MSDKTEVAPGPELVMSGTFAIYREPDGAMHLTYRPVGAEEDIHARIPAAMMRLMSTMPAPGQGGMFQTMKNLVTLRKAAAEHEG